VTLQSGKATVANSCKFGEKSLVRQKIGNLDSLSCIRFLRRIVFDGAGYLATIEYNATPYLWHLSNNTLARMNCSILHTWICMPKYGS
jgi:hypothetical protein